ncbi:hypothetical protein LCGC14_0933920 [marine sediment metagenome]|uniref:YkgJ family cysteine cluster protein n=1 Tax=marine sediment metagenome TaxID=412755 RepID=A0A0F9NRM9_9ZZZZ
MCGDCCRGFKEGEVYLYKEDILTLAKHLNLNSKVGLRKFARDYIKVINDSFFWKQPGAEKGKTYKFKTLGLRFFGEYERCHFLKDSACTVHEARPFQCRCFPFWKMMVSSRKNFVSYSKKCPGLRVLKGKFYPKKEILEWARSEYNLEESFFLEMKTHKFNILKVYPFLPKELVDKEI